MKGDRKKYISAVANIIVFALLETIALTMVSERSSIRKSRLMNSFGFVTSAFYKTSDGIRGYFGLRKENAVLAKENAMLRTKNAELKALTEDIAIKSDSINRSTSVFEYIPAKVVSNTSNRMHNLIVIDKGRQDGVFEDMGVITDKGLIGYVAVAGEHYAKVSSIMDTDNMIGGILKKDNTLGILQWDGSRMNEITLHNIPVHTQFEYGDTVLSSGYSLIYPEGIPIGIITGKDLRDGVNYSLRISTFEQYTRLRYVYVAVRKDMKELDELMKEDDEK